METDLRDMKKALLEALRTHPVIAAARDEKAFRQAISSPVQVIFLLATSIDRLPALAAEARDVGKLLFIHMDFVAGLAKDEAGLEYLVQVGHPVGVITTRSHLVNLAQRLGLIPVQRIFLVDSLSLQTGLESARSSKAEVVEVMPGVIPKAVTDAQAHLPQTLIIAGGLVRSTRQVAKALAAGAAAVSTSNLALWTALPSEFAEINGGQPSR